MEEGSKFTDRPDLSTTKYSIYTVLSSLVILRCPIKIFLGRKQTDGAKWIEGFNSGKHAFEIIFPRSMRGKRSSIGVGTKYSELDNNQPTTLVGKAAVSWGIDLSTKRAYVNGRPSRPYPRKSE